ncbi:DNA topoisomerase I [Thermincola ferriacetica]|uniref:DNA topoisomerase 1 n=1 Tax=Thermincola ferriacetica TaxID=281456 RepID=A0A0L6W5P0_9FIRM|nr:type I DNA topoisomerase [Thermincola ferriacetica]KNZ70897.1 DNA topoisomerase I [Thermincola ferriacetica]
MSKVLVIVESPAKAKTIGKFLGSRYRVKASMGHIRDLPKSQVGVDVEHDFAPKYITIRGKGEILKDLKQAAQKSSKVLLAPDPDREGEAIAWHLMHYLDINEKDKCRIEFNEITKDAIVNAIKEPRTIDRHRVDAQQARRILDRLVGYNLSPLLWRKVKKGLSAGRVQSVAVRLICDREEEIKAFVPEEYWDITGVFTGTDKKWTIEAKLLQKGKEKIHIGSEAEAQAILDDLKDASFLLTKLRKKEKKRNPVAPFITSSLQQEAYRKLNFPARKTMQVAQQLYEGLDLGPEGTVGLVTYIRTDSTRVAETAQAEAREYIKGKFGTGYVPEKARQFTSNGKIQNAHEAIRPTSVFREPDQVKNFLSRDQYKLYKLIWERFVSSQMSPAVLDTTSIDIEAGDYTFRAHGSIIKFPGYMKIYTEGKDEDDNEEEKTLPENLEEGLRLIATSLVPKQHFTQPPPRYTDATLIKALEEHGIGRPSTYAPIVETIQKRGYVVKEQKQFHPTELGMVVVELLKEHFTDIIDIQFTAAMEEKLDLIEEGDMDWVQVLKDFYRPFKDTLERAEKVIGQVELEDEVTEEICELCGRNMVVKMGRYGKFLACPGFPACRNTKPLLEETGVKCPHCDGRLVLRKSKKGRKFYGCSNYPNCDFVTWDLPTEKKCPKCESMLVQKKFKNKGAVYQCISENCNYKEKAETKTI